MLKYSYLPPLKQLSTSTMKEFTIQHYCELINSSQSQNQIIFLFKQILLLLNLPKCTQQSELLRLSLLLQ